MAKIGKHAASRVGKHGVVRDSNEGLATGEIGALHARDAAEAIPDIPAHAAEEDLAGFELVGGEAAVSEGKGSGAADAVSAKGVVGASGAASLSDGAVIVQVADAASSKDDPTATAPHAAIPGKEALETTAPQIAIIGAAADAAALATGSTAPQAPVSDASELEVVASDPTVPQPVLTAANAPMSTGGIPLLFSDTAPSAGSAEKTTVLPTTGAASASPQAPTQTLEALSLPLENEEPPTFVAEDGNTYRYDENGELVLVKKKRHIGRIVGGIAGGIAGAAVVAYAAGAVFFMGHFFPGTEFQGHDLGMEPHSTLTELIAEKIDGYEIAVDGYGFHETYDADELGLANDAEALTDQYTSVLNPLLWPKEIREARTLGEGMKASFAEGGFERLIESDIKAHNEDADPPKNAYIALDDETNMMAVVPEEAGTQLVPDVVLREVEAAVTDMEPSVELDEECLVEAEVKRDDPKLNKSADAANVYLKTDMMFTMGGTDLIHVTGAMILPYLTIDEEECTVTFDQGRFNNDLRGLADSCDTAGTSRTFTRWDGTVITTDPYGEYGWVTDADTLISLVDAGIAAGETSTQEVPLVQSAYKYEGKGTPDWGGRYIDLDLSNQYVTFYDWDGTVIWESPCITGKPDGIHDTNTGVWFVTRKSTNEKLEGYENGVKIYTSYVSYWMPFVGNAIAFHDATWQPGFGGTMYANGYGSHGCVNLPYYAAQSLFYIIEVGDVVVSHW